MADDNKTNVHITHQWGGRDFLTVADDVTGAAEEEAGTACGARDSLCDVRCSL